MGEALDAVLRFIALRRCTGAAVATRLSRQQRREYEVMVRKITRNRLFIEDLELPEPADSGDKDATTHGPGEECSLPPIICDIYFDKLVKIDSLAD